MNQDGHEISPAIGEVKEAAEAAASKAISLDYFFDSSMTVLKYRFYPFLLVFQVQ